MKNQIMLSMQVDRSSLLKAYVRKISVGIVTVALVIFAWTNVVFPENMSANAATLDGVTDQVEGTVDRYVGKVKSAKGDVTDDYQGEIKGGLQQAQGKVKQDIGTTKNSLDDAEDYVEDKSESLVDSVKDFFE